MLYVRIKKPFTGNPIQFPVLTVEPFSDELVQLEVSIRDLEAEFLFGEFDQDINFMLELNKHKIAEWYCVDNDIIRFHFNILEFHFICGIKSQIEKHQF